MAQAQVLGVMTGRDGRQEIAYLNAHLPVTDDLLQATSPLPPTEVLRFAAPCQESRCQHFHGGSCRLAARIVDLLPTAVESLPPCAIRKTCRWHAQEGSAACLRCPQVQTQISDPEELMVEVAGPGADGPEPRSPDQASEADRQSNGGI